MEMHINTSCEAGMICQSCLEVSGRLTDIARLVFETCSMVKETTSNLFINSALQRKENRFKLACEDGTTTSELSDLVTEKV